LPPKSRLESKKIAKTLTLRACLQPEKTPYYKRVGEESVEFILAAKSNDPDHLVAEAADVWFHMLVLMSQKGLGPDDILKELNRREGVSGLAEKAARGND